MPSSFAQHLPDPRIRGLGGEFRDAALEAAFESDRAGDTWRHSRTLLAAAVILNALFLLSDWRFHGTPHFWIAVPARLAVIAGSLVGFILIGRSARPSALQRVMIAWMMLTALGVGVLVSAQSEIALIVTILLPAIFYLCVVVPFRWLLGSGLFASVAMLAGFAGPGLPTHTGLGLTLVMAMLNTALVLVVTRANRLSRASWLAAHTEARLRGELDASRQVLERLFAACPVPLLLADRSAGGILRMSDSCAQLLGPDHVGALHRMDAGSTAYRELTRALDAGLEQAEYETDLPGPDGLSRTLLVKSAALEIEGRPVVLAGLLDITRRKAEQTSLERLASTDALTGLRNRLSFFAAARAEMMRAGRAGTPLAMLMIDIDHFKRINDSLGHSAGDAALRAFAMLCVETLGSRAVIGRLGGEEFGVLLPQTGVSAAALVAEDLCAAAAALTVPHDGARTVRLTVSIGVAGIRRRDRDIDGALARADLALYAAKRAGRNQVMVDQPADGARAG